MKGSRLRPHIHHVLFPRRKKNFYILSPYLSRNKISDDIAWSKQISIHGDPWSLQCCSFIHSFLSDIFRSFVLHFFPRSFIHFFHSPFFSFVISLLILPFFIFTFFFFFFHYFLSFTISNTYFFFRFWILPLLLAFLTLNISFVISLSFTSFIHFLGYFHFISVFHTLDHLHFIPFFHLFIFLLFTLSLFPS